MPLSPALVSPGTALTGLLVAGSMLGSAGWIGLLIHFARHRRLVVFLSELAVPDRSSEAGRSAVAVVFAARDEVGGVEAAVRSMLAEAAGDPALRIIAVDDRSTDGTGEILDRVAAEAPQLAVVHVADLPPGWLGKTHALQVGASSDAAAAARWLLLMDADVVFEPGAIRRAVGYAEAHGVDLVSVAPGVEARSVGERAFLSFFGLLFALYGPIGRLADRRSRAHVGIGAFNLVRAEAFRAVGGFRHLALSVDDDMRLGQTIKFAGYSTRLLFGRGAVAVRWHDGAWQMVRGVEKNFFAGLKFRPSRVVAAALGILALGVGPFAGILVGPSWARAVAAAGIAALATILAASGRQSGIGWHSVILFPPATVLILTALLRSTALTLARGGVEWRRHFYPLRLLKAHVRERDAWLEELWKSTR